MTHKYFPAVLIVLLGLLAYSNTFTVPFQFDDDAYVVNNPAIRNFRSFLHPGEITSGNTLSPNGIPVALRFVFMTRILGYLSLAVNYHLNGMSVTGYHIVNLLIHILNACLVYFILRQTFRRYTVQDRQSGNEVPGAMAIAGALLFLCHPIQTHAVTYITSRFVLLAAFFSLLALAAYIRFRITEAGKQRYGLMAISVVSLSAAMLTKEFTFAVPFMIALYDFSFFPGTLSNRLRTLAPLMLTLVIIPILVLLQQESMRSLDNTLRTITAADTSQITRLDYLLTQFRVIVLYLRLIVLPVGQNIDHDIPVQQSFFVPAEVGSFLLVFSLLVLAGYGYYRSTQTGNFWEARTCSFGIFWFFMALSVESSLIPLGELSAEYRLYLPSVGMIMALTSLLIAAIRRSSINRKTFYAAAALIVMLLCTTTILRNRVWGSEITLWEDAARKSPAKMRPHQNLGIYYTMHGRLQEARGEIQTAIQMDPHNYELHNNLGIVYKQQGDFAGAIREYHLALRLEPTDPMAHYNLGNIYLAQGNLPEAIREYQACLKIATDYDEAHNNLAIAYQRSGQFEAAIIEFKKAIALNPENVSARNNLGICLKKAGGLF